MAIHPSGNLLTATQWLQSSTAMRVRYLITLFLAATAIHGAGLRRVLILPIVNIDNDPNLNYLENSISSALLEKLREKLAFDELSEENWRRARESGHCDSWRFQCGVQKKAFIRSTVYVLDAKRKKVLSKIEMKFPIDSELFNAVTTSTLRPGLSRLLQRSRRDSLLPGLASLGVIG